MMSQTRQLLIVDDDADLRHALVEQLALHPEFHVQAVETAEAALEAVASATPDLIIMDVGLPDLDGREAVKRIRRDGYRRPIIMLTAHDSDTDAVIGPRFRRQRLRRQAFPLRRAAGSYPLATSAI